ncbi:hypothetical protein M408DRAFT_24965 [Serendipita vermifera MAFF 305830]|uniref:RPA43 OB domain-containing protein n=1 Tax=Serendipita vermifera MAFF 305830 TaxID=933852 RepID=A0A0C2XCV0_SERVB|nr:hypothetical protein M408DRAFT_24965 [Serendipita vermifera MAFF 305830]
MTLLNNQQKRKDAPEAIEQPLAKKAKRSKSAKLIPGQDHDRALNPSAHKKKNRDEFRMLQAHMSVNIPASYTGPGKPRQAVLEMLDSILMQYIPNLHGVLLAHSNLEFASQTASFLADSPFAKVDVSFNATVWSPTIGSKLQGTITICSPDHIGLLVHKTFNVSIPRHHIPADEWEFEHGSLENDPEYGAAAENEDGQQHEEGEDSGRWVHKETGEIIGGSTRRLEFTIIGLSIADAMLSLIGSVQPDPFSPKHKPQPAISFFTSGKNRRRSQYSIAEDESVADALLAEDSDAEEEEPFTKEEPVSEDEEEGEESDVVIGEDDPFEQMGRETDKLTKELAREAKKSKLRDKDEEERRRKEEKRERKRKRREERRSNGLVGDEEDSRPKKKKKKDKNA